MTPDEQRKLDEVREAGEAFLRGIERRTEVEIDRQRLRDGMRQDVATFRESIKAEPRKQSDMNGWDAAVLAAFWTVMIIIAFGTLFGDVALVAGLVGFASAAAFLGRTIFLAGMWFRESKGREESR